MDVWPVARAAVDPTGARRGLAANGRSPEAFEVVAGVPLSLTSDPAAARDAFRRQAFPNLNLPFYRKEVRRSHPDTLAAFDERMAAGDPAGAMAALDDRFVDELAGVGDAATVRAKLQDYGEARVTLPGGGSLRRSPDADPGPAARCYARLRTFVPSGVSMTS